MLWKGRRQSDNVQDMRGTSSGRGLPGGLGGSRMRIPMGRGGGGISLSTIIILVVLFFALRACGIDPLQILTGGGGQVAAPGGGGQVSESQPAGEASDEMKQFVSVVLAETEDVWNGIFQAEGLKYEEPQLVLFGGQVQSACGYASSASGRSIAPATRRSISTPPSSSSSTGNSARRAISRKPM